MELSFSELRAKEVVNTQDGRKLGKVIDVALRYPENKWCGIIVPGCRGFGFKKNELFIELRNIVKIGEDVILVNVGFPQKQGGNKPNRCCPPPPTANDSFHGNRNFEELE
jgi:YlmC/YmxH family sporulation protein